MIVSFERRFVFVAIPRTATHAFRAGLRPHLGPRDWEQCVLFERKYFPVEPLARIGHGHIAAGQIRPFLLPGFWAGALKFCTVRNPFERFVSGCHFINRENRRMQTDPLGTMKQSLTKGILFRPQHAFVTDGDGRLLVDFVSRFETLQRDFDEICRRLSLPAAPLQAINRATAPPFETCYDRELEEMVRDAYQKDFELFGYAPTLQELTACA